MAGRRRLERKTDERRPVVTDDFIYDDPQQSSGGIESDSVSSDTPEEAIRKLKGAARQSDQPSASLSEEFPPFARRQQKKSSSEQEAALSSGNMPEQNVQTVSKPVRKLRQPHPLIRGMVLTLVTLLLLLATGAFIFHRINEKTPYLDIPEKLITSAVTPVQSLFSGITESVFGYFRDMDLRANIQSEYNALIQTNEQLVYKAKRADSLTQELEIYQKLSDEVKANQNMKPLDCRIIGKSDSNYFSTLTIDKGTADGVTDDMAVTYNYSLIGYTYNTSKHTSTVITIINTDASIEALIQSTRDQGTVSGTLAVNGKPQCRMNYTPDVSLPRPGDQVVTSGIGKPFPKGILIGTVEESTRGADESQHYIVLNPSADFQHLDHVTVLLYKFVTEDESTSSGNDMPAGTDNMTYTVPDDETDLDSEDDSYSDSYEDSDSGSYGESYGEPYIEPDLQPDTAPYTKSDNVTEVEPENGAGAGSDAETDDIQFDNETEDGMVYESDF